mgnify:FL=1
MIFQREKLAKTQNIDAMVFKHYFKQSQMTITGLVLNRLKLAQLPSNISRIQKIYSMKHCGYLENQVTLTLLDANVWTKVYRRSSTNTMTGTVRKN